MYSRTYLLAGIPVCIESQYRMVHWMCNDYVTERPSEIVVSTLDADLDALAKEQDESIVIGNRRPGYLESLEVYRRLALRLLDRGIILMHGSCVAVDGEAYLFTALSGTGKSTHVRLWREMLGERAVMVNDDKPLLHVPEGEGRVIAYGTPWDGKHHLSTNMAVPLKAIVFLERGEVNEIKEWDLKQIFPILLQQTFKTPDPQVTMKVMRQLSLLAGKVRFYDLHCNMDPEAARVSYEGIAEVPFPTI